MNKFDKVAENPKCIRIRELEAERNELRGCLIQAHMAGQWNNGDGVEPSCSNAQSYVREMLEQIENKEDNKGESQ